jgi:hypothetical protein
MKISGPEHFRLTFDTKRCAVKFSGSANTKLPKLYIVAAAAEVIYVGVTKRKMRERLYSGWNAKGKNGYYGYAFRHAHTEADLYVWCHEDAPGASTLDLETVEAEVVFLIRSSGQWPSGQTEIHFHPSGKEHRELAVSIVRHLQETQGRRRRSG